MSKGILTVGIIILGIVGLLMINIISNYSTSSELDYYLVKETAEAAMVDAVDLAAYRNNGQIRLDSDKFVENFLVRFANSVDNTRDYTVTFYDINEVPPKVSVKVDSKTVLGAENKNTEQVDFSTTYDGIIEANDKEGDEFITHAIKNGDLGPSTISDK